MLLMNSFKKTVRIEITQYCSRSVQSLELAPYRGNSLQTTQHYNLVIAVRNLKPA
jgi:hypothetical protein